MTFQQILENPRTRRMAAAIEDTVSSLRDKDDEVLEGVLKAQKQDLYEATGYRWS